MISTRGFKSLRANLSRRLWSVSAFRAHVDSEDCRFSAAKTTRPRNAAGEKASANFVTTRPPTIQTPARLELLKKICAPFQGLKEGTAEYNALAQSGKAWSSYFKPLDISAYEEFQKENAALFEDIDRHRHTMLSQRRISLRDVAVATVPAIVHQSTAYEGNKLGIEVSKRMVGLQEWEKLFGDVSLSLEDFAEFELPCSSSAPDRQMLEVRNLVALCLYTVHNLKRIKDTAGPSFEQILLLHRILMDAILPLPTSKDLATRTPAWSFNFRGVLRRSCIQSAGHELTVFPYPHVVEGLLKDLVAFRNELHTAAEKKLHPLLIAAHFGLVFKHIYPFSDGNGRMGRFLMSGYLLRQGYPPIFFGDLPKELYIKVLRRAQEGNSTDWCRLVIMSELNTLKNSIKL